MAPFIGSLIVHLLLLSMFALQMPGCGNGKGEEGDKKAAQKEHRDIIPKQSEEESAPEEIAIELIEVPKKPKKVINSPKHLDKDCNGQYFYGGIGIYLNWDKTVTTVVEGYPADEVGIKAGDRIVEPDLIIGEVNTSVTVIVNRNGQILTFTMMRDKICVGDL